MSESDPRLSIAALNDAFRQRGEFFLTPGVMFLPDFAGLMQAVRIYADFTPDNDPYGEHDFGAFGWHDERVYWKIDYYDQTHTQGEDPLSPDCQRVLTVMLAEEY